MIFDLFWRFVLISLLAFGGGGAALPLVERLAVSEAGWVSPQDFAAAVACGYVTPGPVLITATFIGYRAAGLSGAVAATFGVFLMPWLLAAAAAQQLQRFMQHPRLAAASPAIFTTGEPSENDCPGAHTSTTKATSSTYARYGGSSTERRDRTTP